MKKFIKLFALATVLIFTSCEEQENVQLDLGEGFVQFASVSSSIPEEDSTPLNISVLYGGNADSNTNGINVKFTLEGVDANRVSITPADGNLTIPAGEVSADITVETIDNIIVDGNLDFTIVLSTEGDKPVGIAGQNLKNSAYTVTVIDNDCPIVLSDMQGKYSGTDNWYASVGGPLNVSFTSTFDGTDFLTTGLGYAWLSNPDYWGEPVVAEGQVKLEIDPITGDVTIPYQYTATTVYKGTNYDYYVEGSGKYFPCPDKFEIEFLLYYGGKDPVAPFFGVPSFVWKETLTR